MGYANSKNGENTRGMEKIHTREKKFFRNDSCVPPVRKETVEDGSGIFWENDVSIRHPEWFSICPLDGRYVNVEDLLSPYFSEYALVKSRVYVELQWLSYLLANEIVSNPYPVEKCDSFFDNFKFDYSSMKRVKDIENNIKHDVKACELYVAEELKKAGLENLIPYVHLGCTSEDITNCAYALMLHRGMDAVWYPNAIDVIEKLKEMSVDYSDIPMLAHTHGQPATPTTVGKELSVYAYRLNNALNRIESIELTAKFNGATGNYSAMTFAFPDQNWPDNMVEFVTYWLGLTFNPITTQIETHDEICNLMYAISHFNNILLDLQWDIWTYVSLEYFKQIPVKGEVGSSTMPQKVNPINFENGMGNVSMSNAICQGIANKLPVSRMQRDLSDSTVQRNIGLAIGYSVQAILETIRGLYKITVNEQKIAEELDNHWEVLGEAVQTVLRKYGDKDAYNKLKELTRGKTITREIIQDFIKELDLPDEDIENLLALTPADYTGWAEIIANEIDLYF